MVVDRKTSEEAILMIRKREDGDLDQMVGE